MNLKILGFITPIDTVSNMLRSREDKADVEEFFDKYRVTL